MSVTLEGMIERIDSFEEFERRFSQDFLNDDEFLNSTKAFPKTVIFGHTPSLMITRKCEPYFTPAGNIGMDTGLVYAEGLTALIVTEAGKITFCSEAQKPRK